MGRETISVEVLTPSDEQFERTYRLKAQGYNLERLAQRVARLFELPPQGVTSSGTYRHAVKAQSVFCYRAVRELGESVIGFARRLRLSQPAVSTSVKRGERLVKEILDRMYS